MAGKDHGWDKMFPIVKQLLAGETAHKLCIEHEIDRNTLRKYRDIYIAGKAPIAESPPDSRTVIRSFLDSKAPPPDTPPPKPTILNPNATVLAIPDKHHPFIHPDALPFALEVRSRKRTNLTLCLGDEIDACAFSRYPMDPDGLTAGQELQKAIESLLPWYREFPEMLVCESNHTVRPWRLAFDAGLPAAFMPTYAKILNAPDGWQWASRWIIDDVLYIHGDNGKSGQYAHVNYMKAAKRSVVIGHIHSYAGVNYEGHHFGVNAGCLIDETAYCFKYAKNMLTRVNLGCAVIYEGKYAEFVPMRLDQHSRWIGRI
jgi:hypothetical protein